MRDNDTKRVTQIAHMNLSRHLSTFTSAVYIKYARSIKLTVSNTQHLRRLEVSINMFHFGLAVYTSSLRNVLQQDLLTDVTGATTGALFTVS